jgi:SAM-dependent methyltransferase
MPVEQIQTHQGYLDFLLRYLACPIDSSAALRVIRNEDEVIALRSSNGEYPVVKGVPCMMPDLGSEKTPAWKRWERLLEKWLQTFGGESSSLPSMESDPIADYIGEIIGGNGAGLCLDVGCGSSVWTPYMTASGNNMKWIGIDPTMNHLPRRYPFVQGLGEYLPFKSGVFDAVLFSLVLSNILDPLLSMHQAYRSLKPDRRVYIRYYVTPIDARYLVWRTIRTLGLAWQYNQFYQWVYTNRSLRALLNKAGFTVEKRVLLCEICPYASHCPDAGNEFFVIGRRI